MLKRIELIVCDKTTGEVLHNVNRTCQIEVSEDFDVYIHHLADGFIRLIKSSTNNVIQLTSYDLPKEKELFSYVY